MTLMVALLVAAAGIVLVRSGAALLRTDPVERALIGHPLAGLRRRGLERLIDRCEQLVGVGGRGAALGVLGRDLRSHRRRQCFAAGCGALVGAVVLTRAGAHLISLTWAAVAVMLSVCLVEVGLHHRATGRRQRLAGQVVDLAEFLALAATAGLTAAESFDRAASYVAQPLQSWLSEVSADVRSGRSLEQAATDVAARMDVPAFSRLVDAVLTATSRGTPLAATLIAQAADARSQDQARELERAGRAEIAMLVPIVFLVLPAVVTVAVYPGFVSLTSM